MRKITLLLSALLFIALNGFGQNAPDTSWKKGGFIGINLNQVNISQWAPGGESSVAFAGKLSVFANYVKDKTEWANNLDLNYSMVKSGIQKLRKSDDRIELNSKYGRKLNDKWLLSFLFNFKSQFADGYIYPDDSIIVSKFFAPAYITVGLGFTYKPVSYFEVFVSPATAKFTFVTDKVLSDQGAYGLDSGKTVRSEFGAYLNLIFKKDILPNVTLSTKLELFNNYTDKDKDNAKAIDVNWDTSLDMKVNDYITASINTIVVYDANVIKRTQFKETLGIGFGYKFPRTKK